MNTVHSSSTFYCKEEL